MILTHNNRLPIQRSLSGPMRSGIVAAEFAICAPILLLMGLAVADFGRVAHYYETVGNAACTAAETGASQGFTEHTSESWESRVRQAAIDELSSLPGFQLDLATIDIETAIDVDGMVQVAVTVTYPFRTAVTWPGFVSETLLEQQVQFRQFR